MESPTETFLSVARENCALRWVVVVLAFCIAALSTAVVYKPGAPVWVVGENGEIHRGDKRILSWEPIEASRRALELVFVPTDGRDALVDAFFDAGYQTKVKGITPRDPFIAFNVKKSESRDKDSVIVTGVLMRREKPPTEMTVTMARRQRSELNPFGLVVVNTTLVDGE